MRTTRSLGKVMLLGVGLFFSLFSCGGGKDAGSAGLPEKAADLKGTWKGALSVQGTELPLVFHFSFQDGGITGSMDSPAQGTFGIPLDGLTADEDGFTASYMKGSGKLRSSWAGLPETLEAEWIQGGGHFPLTLLPSKEETVSSRPQEPKPPYPYIEEEVTFSNREAGITLGGTLTLPEGSGPFPAVVLVSGSGQQNRDEEIFGHRPFLVLSDYLTRRGFAVLRYDDRGIGASGGTETLKTATSEDFARDAAAALAYLRSRPEVRKDAVGLIGHSEGGIIGQILAAGDGGPDFLIFMAGPALMGKETLLHQAAAYARAGGVDEETVASQGEINRRVYNLILHGSGEEAEEEIKNLLLEAGLTKEEAAEQLKMVTLPWFKTFLAFQPEVYLPKIRVPVLALFGEKDVQVVAAYEAPRMRELLAASESEDVTVKVLPGLNHLFQTAETGLPSEYGLLEETLSPVFLESLARWLERF